MRILVTGCRGQVARSLAEIGRAKRHEVITVGRPALDLAGDSEPIITRIMTERPEAIVSAAAYTAVDKAEAEPEIAFATNRQGAAAVADAARRLSVPLVHLSTDYVFDGKKSSPYTEEDPTQPTSVYGASKLAGEQAVLAEHSNSAILRTAWVYSPFGANFVRTMLRLGEQRDEVAIVADQIGNPTGALDIAEAILVVLANLVRSNEAAYRGTFHMTAEGSATWADFGEAIFEASARLGGPSASVKRITTAEYPRPARRPANSQLDCSRLERIHQVRLPHWRSSLGEVVSRILSNRS
jgi:dTDP-4-dehydrorhamnose reductase